MTKEQLVMHLVGTTMLRPSQAKEAVEAVFTGISEALAKGDSVNIRGFATIKPYFTKARIGFNFSNGQRVAVEPQPKVRIILSEKLKERMNDGC